MHRRSDWFQGYLDKYRGDVLPAGFNQFLASTRAVGIKSAAVSLGEYRDACGMRDFAVASAASVASQRSLARRGDLGAAPGAGRIGGVGD